MKNAIAVAIVGLLCVAGVMQANAQTNQPPVTPPPPAGVLPQSTTALQAVINYIATNGYVVGGYGAQFDGSTKKVKTAAGVKKTTTPDNAGPTTGLNVDMLQRHITTNTVGAIGVQTWTLFGRNVNAQLIGVSQSLKWNTAGIGVRYPTGAQPLFATVELGAAEGYPVDLMMNNRFYASKVGVEGFFATSIPF